MKSCTYLFFILYLITAAAANTLQHANYYRNNQNLNISDYYVSEKLDGFRAYWDGNTLKSKNGYSFNAPNWYTENLGNKHLDGELWIGRGQFEKLISILNTVENEEEWHLVNYMIFDMPNEVIPFSQRVKKMQDYIPSLNLKYVQMIPQIQVSDHTELNILLDKIIKMGGEGLMLHHQNAYYGSGRVNHLLKIKKYDENVGVVISYNSGKGKYKGKVGSLNLRLDDDTVIRVGSGLTDIMRENPPEIGQRIAFIYNGLTNHGKPRFARFKRILNENLE